MSENIQKVRVRFAPSPTGSIHIGNLRTALFAWLFAKNKGGDFLVRLEDTDRKRLEKDSVKKIFQALKWVNLTIDEGVCLNEQEEVSQKGEKGPYIQSERLPTYKKYIQQLLQTGNAYYCFCSEERLKAVHKKQQEEKLPIMYDKHCRNLSEEEIKIKIQAGEKYVIRMKIPDNEVISFEDKVFGKISVKTDIIDDQVLIKADGFPTYHFAVVVDDHLMEISHIFRGEDWISSTPKHVLLYQFFGWSLPTFIHLPNVLGEDKKKLSKRAGAVSVEDFVKKGYLSEALINFLVLLGWNSKTEQEIFSREELIKKFNLEGLNKAGAIFNYQKLNWFNKEYLKLMKEEDFKEKVLEFLPDEIKEKAVKNPELLEKFLFLIKERIEKFEDIKNLAEAGEFDYYFIRPDYPKEKLLGKNEIDLDQTKKHLEKIVELLHKVKNWLAEEIKIELWNYATEQGRGNVLWPMRYALSGKDKSPDPFMLAEMFGQEETFQRLQYAIKKIEEN